MVISRAGAARRFRSLKVPPPDGNRGPWTRVGSGKSFRALEVLRLPQEVPLVHNLYTETLLPGIAPFRRLVHSQIKLYEGFPGCLPRLRRHGLEKRRDGQRAAGHTLRLHASLARRAAAGAGPHSQALRTLRALQFRL